MTGHRTWGTALWGDSGKVHGAEGKLGVLRQYFQPSLLRRGDGYAVGTRRWSVDARGSAEKRAEGYFKRKEGLQSSSPRWG